MSAPRLHQTGLRVRGGAAAWDTVQAGVILQEDYFGPAAVESGGITGTAAATIAITTPDGKVAPLGVDQSKALWDHLRAAGHIDAKGKVQDSLKVALKDGKLALPGPSSPTGARWLSCCAR